MFESTCSQDKQSSTSPRRRETRLFMPISLSNLEAALMLASARILGGVRVARDPLQRLIRTKIY